MDGAHGWGEMTCAWGFWLDARACFLKELTRLARPFSCCMCASIREISKAYTRFDLMLAHVFWEALQGLHCLLTCVHASILRVLVTLARYIFWCPCTSSTAGGEAGVGYNLCTCASLRACDKASADDWLVSACISWGLRLSSCRPLTCAHARLWSLLCSWSLSSSWLRL